MAEQFEDIDHYLQLIELNDSTSIVPNAEEFDCSICFTTIKPYQGVILRECLHMFCKLCLEQYIESCEDASIKCPFIDRTYSCGSHILESEIRSLASPEIYQKYLSRTVLLAERQAKDAYHCKTPNCPGWCINEEKLNIFRCPVCLKENCINCEEIHMGISCDEYRTYESKDKSTVQTLLSKLACGSAMRCPRCKAIIEKISGCDGMVCTLCKSELCWATKGLRWGPQGPGDTSGGCRCNVNGIRCHPTCRNCH